MSSIIVAILQFGVEYISIINGGGVWPFSLIRSKKLVTLATSLEQSQNECPIDHLQSPLPISTGPENLVKMKPVHFEKK